MVWSSGQEWLYGEEWSSDLLVYVLVNCLMEFALYGEWSSDVLLQWVSCCFAVNDLLHRFIL